MTWPHYQQLRSAAAAHIQRRLQILQPQGGWGATVNGEIIALDPKPGPPPASPEEDWLLGIFATVHYQLTYTSGGGHSHSGVDGPDTLAVLPRSGRPKIAEGYFYERTQFFQHSQSSRRVTVKLEALSFRPKGGTESAAATYARARYRFPVRVTLDHVVTTFGRDGIIAARDDVAIGHGGYSFTPRPANDEDFFERHISNVERI